MRRFSLQKFFLLLLPLFVAFFLLSACQKPSGEIYVPSAETPEVSPQVPGTEAPEAKAPSEITSPPPPPEEKKEVCTHNSNCTSGNLCIEGQCQLLADFYKTDSACQKCRLAKIEILTSDGETYLLPPGQGSYTAAGALDWEILSAPQYCQGETPSIPVKILKRNYQNIFSDEIILLKAGQTSPVITHPFVKRIAFTLTVQKVEEACS